MSSPGKPMSHTTKVKHLPLQPHCFAFGGFEIQMLLTLEAIQKAGVAAERMDVWSRDSDFDILHVWGLDQAQYNTIYWAKKSGKKVVVTALLPYIDSVYGKLRNFIFSYTDNEKYMRKIASMIDALVVVNDTQKKVAVAYFGASPQTTVEIPHIVSPSYFDVTKGKFSAKYDISDYVLSVGNICQRKNQLNLAKACLRENVNLVLIGPVLPGDEHIGMQLEEIVRSNRNVVWIKGLAPGSEDLAHAFFDCALYALPSHIEQQPISALEAAAAGKPLLLADRPYAKQNYYQNCALVDPNAIQAISAGIKNVLAHPEKHMVPRAVIDACRPDRVGRKYQEIYERL